MGVFVAHADFGKRSPSPPTTPKPCETASTRTCGSRWRPRSGSTRAGAPSCPGTYDARTRVGLPDRQRRRQPASAAAEICEPAGLVMVLEPLNARRDHPGLFLTEDSPGVHDLPAPWAAPPARSSTTSTTSRSREGNLIPNIDRSWSEIAYFQVGDNPGRKEPTTGEINYRNVFRHIHEQGLHRHRRHGARQLEARKGRRTRRDRRLPRLRLVLGRGGLRDGSGKRGLVLRHPRLELLLVRGIRGAGVQSHPLVEEENTPEPQRTLPVDPVVEVRFDRSPERELDVSSASSRRPRWFRIEVRLESGTVGFQPTGRGSDGRNRAALARCALRLRTDACSSVKSGIGVVSRPRASVAIGRKGTWITLASVLPIGLSVGTPRRALHRS